MDAEVMRTACSVKVYTVYTVYTGLGIYTILAIFGVYTLFGIYTILEDFLAYIQYIWARIYSIFRGYTLSLVAYIHYF